MMKIRVILGVVVAMTLSLIGVAPANAVTRGTTVTIEVPTYAGKNVTTRIFVHVCSGENKTTGECQSVTRSIGLYVDGKRVKLWSSASNSLAFDWKSSSVKKHTIQAKVVARSGYKAANSSAKTVTVKTGMLDTQAEGWSAYTQCGGVCTQLPVAVFANIADKPDFIVWLGSDSRQAGRKVYLQYQSYNGSWLTEDFGIATWDADVEQYGVALNFDLTGPEYCPDYEDAEWEYRVYIPATSRATQTSGYYRALHVDCADTFPSYGSAVADFDYRDQYTDTPDDFWFFPYDPDDNGFTLKTQYCLPDESDCSDDTQWTDWDSYEFYGDPMDWVSLSVRPEYQYSTELVRAVVMPSDGSTVSYSSIYTVYTGY